MRRLSHKKFVERVKEKYPELQVMSEYSNTRTPIQVYCSKPDAISGTHGTYTIKDVSAFLYGKNNRNGCKKCANENRSSIKTLFSMNHDYFSVLSLETCYWAGFIAADGCVINDRHISIKLSQKDHEHLLAFMKNTEYTGNLYEYSRKSNFYNKKVYSHCEIYISNAQKWTHDLQANFNVESKKSLTYTHPIELTNEQSLAFIKGYIDGDGHIKTSEKRTRIGVVGTLETLIWIQKHFDRIAPASSLNGMVAKPRKLKNCQAYYYEIASRRAEKVIEILKSISTPCLKRKWGLRNSQPS